MKALITGAHGFVGRHLAAHLHARGDEVVAVDRECDVTDLDAISAAVRATRPDAVYHLAGLSHVGASWSDPEAYTRVNVVGTQHVLAAARAGAPDATVLVVSSADVYGAVDEAHLPLDEDAPVAPLSPYAASKVEAERVARDAAHRFGQSVIVVRPFNHIGPGQSPRFAVAGIAARLRAARAAGETSVAVGDLSVRRDFTDVRDVVRAYRLMIEDGAPGAFYHVASNHDVALADVARRLGELIDPRITFRVEAAWLRPLDVPVLRGSYARLARDTGWSPTWTLDQTLRDVAHESD